MLCWLMNLGFAGGAAPVVTILETVTWTLAITPSDAFSLAITTTAPHWTLPVTQTVTFTEPE